jgi:Leucine-rich repeat (LRR) protein
VYEIENLELFSLKSIQKLVEIDGLKRLTLVNAKSIDDFSVIGELTNLEYLELENCGKIDTIQFIQKCKNLEHLVLTRNTNILDGNPHSEGQ